MIAEELKNTKIGDLVPVAEKLRERLVETVRQNGGHLSSNLGAVELTLALCRAFDFPKDKIVFDVGHQSYVYKLLSGRDLDRLRRKGGESGFPDPQESEDDCFLAGHSGTSVAAGIGLCNARDARGEDFYVVSVIGDASLGNGLALEAVFSSENKPKKFVVVLNDNGMSIGKNTSALYRALSKATAKAGYRRVDRFLDRTFKTTSAFGRQLRRIKYSIKGWLNKNAFFERCGFKYVGPVNGHDLAELVSVLEGIRSIDEPVLLHVVTQKGHGYTAAEEDPARFHGVNKNFAQQENSFSVALGRLLSDRAEKDGCLGLITGESIGQVASQTMQSLAATNAVCTLPVYRPLIGFDKREIVEISEKIDTYETSIQPFEDCCTIFVAKHPVTKPNVERIEKSELNLSENIEELVKTAVETAEVITVGK